MGLLIRALVATLIAVALPGAATAADVPSDAAVRAAFVFNFAKFTEWPGLAAGAPIVACVAKDEDIAAALTAIVRGETIGGHAMVVWRRNDDSPWEGCQVLFMPGGAARDFASVASAIRTRPVLTVSGSPGFSQHGGMIELFVDGGRLRFAINVDAVDRAGLHISSRLLGLAKVVHDDPVR
jgi:hypothetical protein